MTLPDADIWELARPRRLITRELYPFNAFYGHADLFRRYAGIEGDQPLKAALEHGPTLFPDPRDPDLRTWLPRYFCAAETRAAYFEERRLHTSKPIAIGPPIMYAHAMSPPATPTSRRLVFFDAHSSDYVTVSYDLDAALTRLALLRDDFDEVVVCLYWRDILFGRAERYIGAGYKCVTAGHIFDPRFLFRLVEIISSATVVLTDRVGTHLLYALALGRPVWLDYAAAEYELMPNAPHGPYAPEERGVVERATALFSRRAEDIQPDQRAFVEDLAGVASFRSPKDLAALIESAESAFQSEVSPRRRLQLKVAAVSRRTWNSRGGNR